MIIVQVRLLDIILIQDIQFVSQIIIIRLKAWNLPIKIFICEI